MDDPLNVDLKALAEICHRYGVAELAVFGSASRGESAPDSDIDILYVLAPETHLGWALEDLNDELTALFGRPVDLVSRRSVHPRLAPAIEAESKVLYAA